MKINPEIIGREKFPPLLKEIPDCPQKLFVLGKIPDVPINISIVGTRKATSVGLAAAKKLAKELAELGITVVSGLAMGIDSAVHKGVIEANARANKKGKTIAVLANGLDKIYPAQNENLAQKILESGGAIISEYPENTPPYPNQFLERNRIISGLCQATIVIEAPQKSGSLATARFALEQGREVFVIPGPASHSNYAGSHQLIRSGARLITSVSDILEDLGIENVFQKKFDFNNLANEPQREIIKAINQSGKPINIDKIIELTKLSPQIANREIAALVIQNAIKESGGNYFI
ncbi:MAG: DNA-processing protein DprA [Patescibacteria group bacterium]|nr:DNA-processing protein DprA [Patescibacteria group bacterium]